MKRVLWSILLTCSVLASSNGEYLNSLTWQKKDLETKIIHRVENVIKVLLQEDTFYVDVEIQTNIPEAPNFDEKLNPDSEEDTLAASTTNKVEESELEKLEKVEDLDKDKKESKAQIKFNNILPNEDVEDVVVFSKLGIEAPLIDDFNDFHPDGKIVLTMANDEDKKQLQKIKNDFDAERRSYEKTINELRQKGKGKPSIVEQMWKYNNTLDIFQNLLALKVKISLPENLDMSLRDKIENQVKALNFNLGDVKAKYSFEYTIKKIEKVKEKTAQEKLYEMIALLGRFANVFAVIGGMLLLAVVGNILINKWFKLNTGVTNTGNFKMEGDTKSEKDDGDDKSAGAGGFGGDFAGDAGVSALNGVERFKYYFENAPKEGMLLVKKWISSDEEKSKSALRAIVQQLDNVILKSIFEQINERERRSWQGLLDKPLTSRELAVANDFISGQIVQSVILPSMISDPETYDLVLKLHHSKIPDMYENKPELTAMLLNALHENFVAEVLMDCSPNQVNEILSKAFKYGASDIREHEQEIKGLLVKYVEDQDHKPFVDKVLNILPKVTAEVEKSIFMNIKDHVTYSLFRKIAGDVFPSELITQLPEGFLKNSLTNYPLKKKIRMLLAIEEDTRDLFLSIFAPEGTKASDLVKIEFESIESDASQMEKINLEKHAIWKEFVDYVRGSIKVEKQYKFEIENLLNDWCDNMSQSARPQLRAVS